MTTWLTQVSKALEHHPERESIIAELTDLLNSGITPESFGNPEEFCASLFDYLSDSSSRTWKEHISGLLADPAPRLAWFDPSNPQLLIPRTIGFGWDINFGAVATKLGLLRPDDIDDDVVAAIPDRIINAIRIAPATLTVASLALAFAMPNMTGPTKYSIIGGPSGAKNLRKYAFFSTAGLAGIAGFSATRTLKQDQLVTSSITAGIALAVVLQLTQMKAHSNNPLWNLARVAAIASPILTLSRAITAGVKRVTK